MDIKATTTFLLSEVSNKYRTEFEKAMNRIGLHGGQVFVLLLLFETDGQSQAELACRLNVTAPTVNSMVKSLINNLFAVCSKCPMDRRVMRVYLSEKASNVKGQILESWLKFEKDFFSNLTSIEKLLFFQLLEKLKVTD